MPDFRPMPLSEWSPVNSSLEPDRETADLRLLLDAGLPVAPVVVVPAPAEEEFYRLNNLAARLEALFCAVDLVDPDDEDVEDLSPAAQALVADHYLLDEFIDAFYESTATLPDTIRVRRPDDAGSVVRRGRASLLALKGSWSGDWAFDALWARLSVGGPLLPRARSTLLHAPAFERMSANELDAAALLGSPVTLLGDPRHGITTLRRPAQR
jgi:hypothetical protein